jgi:signal peptidase I
VFDMPLPNAHSKKSYAFFRYVIETGSIVFIVFLIRTFIFGLYQVPTGSMETTMLVGERFFADKLTYFFRTPERGEIVALMQPMYSFSTNPIKRFIERYLWGPANWTKRIIGCPGDHVKGMIEDGKPVLYLNGIKLYEPYLNTLPLITVRNNDGTYIRKTYDPLMPYNEQPFYTISDECLYRNQRGNTCLIYQEQARILPIPLHKRGSQFWGECADEFDVVLGANEYWVMGDNRRGSHDSRYFGPIKQDTIFARISWLLFSIDTTESWIIVDLIKNPLSFWRKIRKSRTLTRLA